MVDKLVKDARTALEDGDMDVAISKGREAVKKATTVADTVKAVTMLADALRASDDASGAMEVVNEKLEEFKGKDKKGDAALMLQRAETCLAQQDADGAMEAAVDAQGLARKANDATLECQALIASVNAQLQKQARTPALKSANSALALAQQSGERECEAAAWVGIAKVHMMSDDDENSVLDVLQAAEKASDMYSGVGSKAGEAEAKSIIGRAHLKLGNTDEAVPAAERAFRLYKQTGITTQIVAALELVLQTYGAIGRAGEGLSMAQQYRDECAGKGEKVEAASLRAMATAYVLVGDSTEAFRVAKEARSKYRQVDDKIGEAWCELVISEIHSAEGRRIEAMQSAEGAMSGFRSAGSRDGVDAANHILSALYASIGQVKKAPDRKLALQHLKDMNKAVEARDLEAFRAARRKAEALDKYLLEYDMMDALAPAFDRDYDGARNFLEEQGYEFEKEKTGAQQIRHFDHMSLYFFFRTQGGMGFGPQFRSTNPYRVKQSDGNLRAMSATCLPETEDWEMKLSWRPGILDSGLQCGACLGFQ